MSINLVMTKQSIFDEAQTYYAILDEWVITVGSVHVRDVDAA